VSDAPYAEPAPLEGSDHEALVALVAAAAADGPEALRLLWDELVVRLGPDSASRLWQEGLAQGDADQQT
jgi:hypothetical protein